MEAPSSLCSSASPGYGTHLGKSLVLMLIFGAASTAVSSISVRHRG